MVLIDTYWLHCRRTWLLEIAKSLYALDIFFNVGFLFYICGKPQSCWIIWLGESLFLWFCFVRHCAVSASPYRNMHIFPMHFLRVQHFEEEKGRKVLHSEWDPLSAGRLRYKPIHFISVTDTVFSKFHYFSYTLYQSLWYGDTSAF